MSSFSIGDQVLAIVPAAGSSRRMETGSSKLLITLSNKKTVLEESLYKLYEAGIRRVLLPSRTEDSDSILNIAKSVGSWELCECTPGGKSRFESIKNAIDSLLEHDTWNLQSLRSILVHDAARPFISSQRIRELCVIAQDNIPRILAIPSIDTLKKIDKDSKEVIKTLDRETIWQVQTPQIFPIESFIETYRSLSFSENFTDDASLFEHRGLTVRIHPGEAQNIKITRPFDIAVSEAILNK